DDLPVRIGRAGHLEVARKRQHVFAVLDGVRHRSGVDGRACELRAGVRLGARERGHEREGRDTEESGTNRTANHSVLLKNCVNASWMPRSPRRFGQRAARRRAWPSTSRITAALRSAISAAGNVTTFGETSEKVRSRRSASIVSGAVVSSVVCQCAMSFARVSGGSGRSSRGARNLSSFIPGTSAAPRGVVLSRAPNNLLN